LTNIFKYRLYRQLSDLGKKTGFLVFSIVRRVGLKRFVFFERNAGFADRFVRMRQAIQVGNKLKVPVFVHWPENKWCNDHYLNFFQEIKNVIFVDKDRADFLRGHQGRIDDELILANSTRRPPPGEKFSMLMLKPEYIRLVKDFVARNNIEDAIGFHIRTTDNIRIRGGRRGINFQFQIFDQIAKETEKRIFLATDNIEIREEFVRNYNKKIIFYDTEFNAEELRQTPLKSAIIELFVLAHCAEFYGTTGADGKIHSAFSRMAKHMRMERRLNFLPGFEMSENQ